MANSAILKRESALALPFHDKSNGKRFEMKMKRIAGSFFIEQAKIYFGTINLFVFK